MLRRSSVIGPALENCRLRWTPGTPPGSPPLAPGSIAVEERIAQLRSRLDALEATLRDLRLQNDEQVRAAARVAAEAAKLGAVLAFVALVVIVRVIVIRHRRTDAGEESAQHGSPKLPRRRLEGKKASDAPDHPVFARVARAGVCALVNMSFHLCVCACARVRCVCMCVCV